MQVKLIVKSVVVCLMSVAVLGCGGGDGIPTGKVAGTVTYSGGPLTGANATFFCKEFGSGGSAPIGADGKFAFTDPLRTGQYIVTITPPPAPPPLPVANAPAAIPPPAIPPKYASVETTDLKVEVKSGSNDIPLTLK